MSVTWQDCERVVGKLCEIELKNGKVFIDKPKKFISDATGDYLVLLNGAKLYLKEIEKITEYNLFTERRLL